MNCGRDEWMGIDGGDCGAGDSDRVDAKTSNVDQ